ncbi:fibronectin type III domain-containing protein [Mycobacterium intracellulare]|uniref:fibronectin type III domain-containing protein n=1 Tax=Mycobacterium intracellulare TaxID=1767 RepID=UPI001925D544|nr:fibronectin type III domain-containing protein [Mycobacterium intracellulare]MCA2275505.1 fibronectin type III domain-containing protein [Mycobacterium intracellulare]MCA2324465.1 fibronectin type III domain-containing protein [Mycobacterium intracellulare]BCP29608.1 hypothetical protein MINTM026_05780 [Mycobacterium intracellulare]
MTGLPATGGTWAQLIQPGLNPLAIRYGQITDIFIRDYFNADGSVFNLADPAVGLAPATLADGTVVNLFTPFAADGISIRPDLLVTAPGSNLGFYHVGLLKEDTTSITPDQTLQETPTAQQVRTARNVLTKLSDKIMFEPVQETPLTRYLRYELPTINGVPELGTPGLIIPRGNTDVPVDRIIIAMIVDGDGQLLARVFPHVITDKKGKEDLARKNPLSSQQTYEVLPCYFAKQAEWTCYAGTQWNASGNFEFETTAPKVTPVTGLTATVVVPTPADLTDPTYAVALQETEGGAFAAGTLSGSPTVSGAWTTLTVSDLTASQAYNALQVTATSGEETVTSPVSASFTATAS